MTNYYTPIFRKQIGDPTTTRDAFICTMEAGAMGLDYHTHGALQLWGGQLEQHQTDHVGGTDLYDLATAWKYYGQTLVQGTGGWDGVKAALAQHRAVILQGIYGAFPSAYSCQAGFTEGHCILLIPDVLQWARIGDPLCNAFKNIPEQYVKAYAEQLNSRVQFAITNPQPLSVGNTLYIETGVRKLYLAKTAVVDGIVKVTGWDTTPWSGIASSAPCRPEQKLPGISSGSATVAFVTRGAANIVSRYVHTGIAYGVEVK